MSARFTVGQLVEYTDSPGIGKVVGVSSSHLQVEFFESVAKPSAASASIPLGACQHVSLMTETRVYRRNPDTGMWLAGRIKGQVNTGEYFVSFPNVEYDLPVQEKQLHVRWDRPVADPVLVLTSGGNESGYFSNARLPFLRNLVGQRAACASVSALLSSAVEFFPHQVHAALTVLSDPVQRYLLADEVGLGKTIEAGYVIRQTLIDNPRAKICVITPDVLRRQWQRELREKFFIDDFPSATIRILRQDEPERWASWEDSDLVVVDEAHQLVQVTNGEVEPYRSLARLAHGSTRLLLMTATPVMSNHVTQLALLHLLDPSLYRWSDLESFERKYRLRARLASSVYSLDSEFTYMLKDSIDEISELIPESDNRFQELGEHVLSMLDENDELREGEDEAELKARTEALRAHISEAYRLHRRVIRHRRSRVTMDDPDAVYIPYEVRGRQKPEALVTDSEQHELSQTRLMDWRSATWDHLLDHGLEKAKVAYGRVLGILASRANGWVNDLTDALSWRVEREDDAAVRAGLSAYERVLLTEAPVLNVERELLAEWRAEEQTDDGESINAVVSSLLPALKTSTRTVIFCGPGMLAGVVAERMSKRFQKVAVHEHSHRVGPQESEHSLVLWASESMPRVHVLVTDDSAEEGLNLQLADTIIHLRLPWSPNDLEQRLGRVDRYPGATGQREAARQYRLASEEPDSYSEAWATLLERGYDLFTESVSTLQDAIAGGLDRVWTAGYESGAEGLRGMVGEVRDSLREARLDIDKMDLLESIHETSIAGRDVTSSLLEMETFWRDVHKTLVGYVDIDGGIGLAFHERTVGKSPAVAFDLSASTPKIDPRLWKRARPELTTAAQGAFNRNVALRHPGTRLLRVGNPLIDVLAEAVYLDDRGQATAFRRVDQRYRGDAHAHFGFHYLVEADLTDALLLVEGNANASRALRRQADRLLTPFTMKVWVNASTGLPITEPGILTWLEQPYNNRSDQNYNARFLDELLDVFNGWDGYRSSGSSCEQIARDHLLKTKELSERCRRAQDEARQRVAVTVAQARTRQLAGHLVGDTESLLTDVDITQALIERLTQPTVKVVAATCVVRAGLRSAAR